MFRHRAQVPGAGGAGVDGRRALCILQVGRRQDARRDLQRRTKALYQAILEAPTSQVLSRQHRMTHSRPDAGCLTPACVLPLACRCVGEAAACTSCAEAPEVPRATDQADLIGPSPHSARVHAQASLGTWRGTSHRQPMLRVLLQQCRMEGLCKSPRQVGEGHKQYTVSNACVIRMFETVSECTSAMVEPTDIWKALTVGSFGSWPSCAQVPATALNIDLYDQWCSLTAGHHECDAVRERGQLLTKCGVQEHQQATLNPKEEPHLGDRFADHVRAHIGRRASLFIKAAATNCQGS